MDSQPEGVPHDTAAAAAPPVPTGLTTQPGAAQRQGNADPPGPSPREGGKAAAPADAEKGQSCGEGGCI